MARLGFATPGKTLELAQGFAGLRAPDLGFKVRRTALTALAIGALIAGLSATSVALGGHADPGVDYNQTGSTIVGVNHSGYAWRYGVQPGDAVVSITDSDLPGGWVLVTRDAAGNTNTTRASSADAAVADSLAIGVGAVVLAGMAVLFLSTRRRWVVPTASFALLAASVPLGLQGAADTSTVVLAAAAIVPAVNLGRRLAVVLVGRLVLALGLLIFFGAWAMARLWGSDASDELELLRGEVAFWGSLALFADRAVVPILRGETIGLMRPRLFDVAIIAAFAVVGLV